MNLPDAALPNSAPTHAQTKAPSPPAKSVKPAKPGIAAAKKKAVQKASPAAKPSDKKITDKKVEKPSSSAPARKVADKTSKIKLVRDSIAIPKNEYAVLGELKLRCAKQGAPVKKTELIRAGIMLLASLSDKALLTATGAVPSLKTGRPPKQG